MRLETVKSLNQNHTHKKKELPQRASQSVWWNCWHLKCWETTAHIAKLSVQLPDFKRSFIKIGHSDYSFSIEIQHTAVKTAR